MNKSIILPAFFKGSISDINLFVEAINIVKKFNISTVEFFYDGKEKEHVKSILKENNLKSIYLGAITAKINKLNLSSVDEGLRKTSVNELKKCISDGYFFGADSVLINSGQRPKNADELPIAYNALKKSIKELLQYTEEIQKNYIMTITLEPGDINIDYRELIGGTDLAIKLVQDIQKEYLNFGLTLDLSHLKQLNEKPIESIEKAFNYCHHIHFANCVIKNKTSYLYGDKHPEFGIDDGEISYKDLINFYEKIINTYQDNELTIGIEIICREDDKKKFFKKTVSNLHWFFVKSSVKPGTQ